MEKLGVELPLLLAQIVNFAIMLFILTKLLYKPILKALQDRRKKIEEGLAFAEKAKHEEEKLEKRKHELLKEAKDEAKVIFEQAKKEAKKQKEEILEEGRREVLTMKSKLEKEMQGAQEQMKTELTAQTVDIASEMVRRLLGEVMTDENQHKLFYKQLQKLEKVHERRQ